MEKANTPLEQICFNTRDIKKLKEQIAPLYKSNVNLGALADAVDVADTNLTTDIEKAFIIDFNGNVYKFIAFNEDKTKAYIEYYASIKGEKGDTGATGADGQNGQDGANGLSIRYYNGIYINSSTNYLKTNLSNTDNLQIGDVILFKDGTLTTIQTITTLYFTVSSSNIKLEIQATTKGAFIAFSQPTESGDFLVYAPTAIYNKTANTQFSAGDLIIYVDSNGNPTEIYLITGFSGDNLIVELKGTYAKGKQLYQHNIIAEGTTSSSYGTVKLYAIITNNSSTPLTYSSLRQYLIDKGFTSSAKIYTDVNGWANDTTYSDIICGIYLNGESGTNIQVLTRQMQSGNVSTLALRDGAVDSFIDTVNEI